MARFQIVECFEVRHTLGQHPGITRLGNDDLLLVYGDYTDGMEGQQGYLIRSVDDGRTWSDPELVLAARWWHGGTHSSLGLQTLRDGRVLLPWCHGGNAKKHTFCPLRFVCLRSDDHGRTWQGWDDQDVGLHRIVPYGKIVELADGTLLAPGWGMVTGREADKFGSRALRSSDRGATWRQWTTISDRHGANETDLTLLPDGRILALIRTTGVEGPEGRKVYWTDYAHCEDGGLTWSPAGRTNVVGQNLNAWITPRGTLIAACRGIDGTSRLRGHEIRDADRRYAPRQVGYGIHFFVAEDDGANWAYQFTLPDPAGRAYTEWHESGEPCFCTLPNGDILVAYYSYDESIYQTLTERPMPAFAASEAKRIAHCFKRRICACILREADRRPL